MKPVTIDNLDIKEHVRWAQDRAVFDPALLQELAPHSEIVGTSIIFSSHLEGIFHWDRGMRPWANFAPPHNAWMLKRFFSYRLFPTIDGQDSDEEEKHPRDEDEEEPQHKKRSRDKMQRILAAQHSTHALFEKDKNVILSLLASIQSINEMLAQIATCKVQYQKG